MLLKYIGTQNFQVNTGFSVISLYTGETFQCTEKQYKFLLGNYSSLFQNVVTIDSNTKDDVPTITSLPDWGTGVDMGTTTEKSVTFGDDKAFDGQSTISITTTVGTITGLNTTSYGIKTFSLVAPETVEEPTTATITYSITDSKGTTVTTTQDVDINPV